MKFVIEAEKQICLFSFDHGNSSEAICAHGDHKVLWDCG